MTVIACRDGIMAADSGVYHDQLLVGYATKIVRHGDGSLAAAAGRRPLVQAFHRWIEAGALAESHPPEADEESFGAIWLKPDRKIYRVSHKFEVYDDAGSFAAEGIAVSFMLGAMAYGASAEDAVRLALKWSAYACGEIQLERL